VHPSRLHRPRTVSLAHAVRGRSGGLARRPPYVCGPPHLVLGNLETSRLYLRSCPAVRTVCGCVCCAAGRGRLPGLVVLAYLINDRRGFFEEFCRRLGAYRARCYLTGGRLWCFVTGFRLLAHSLAPPWFLGCGLGFVAAGLRVAWWFSWAWRLGDCCSSVWCFRRHRRLRVASGVAGFVCRDGKILFARRRHGRQRFVRALIAELARAARAENGQLGSSMRRNARRDGVVGGCLCRGGGPTPRRGGAGNWGCLNAAGSGPVWCWVTTGVCGVGLWCCDGPVACLAGCHVRVPWRRPYGSGKRKGIW